MAAFLSVFLSYVLLLVIIVVLVIVAVIIGIKLRQNKDKKMQMLAESNEAAEVQQK